MRTINPDRLQYSVDHRGIEARPCRPVRMRGVHRAKPAQQPREDHEYEILNYDCINYDRISFSFINVFHRTVYCDFLKEGITTQSTEWNISTSGWKVKRICIPLCYCSEACILQHRILYKKGITYVRNWELIIFRLSEYVIWHVKVFYY